MDFASFVYFPKRKNEIIKLERIQYAAIRLALGYRISTPTNILIAESKLMYIKYRSKFLCLSYLSKILSNSSLTVNKSIHKSFSIIKITKRKSLLLNCINDIIPLRQTLQIGPHYNIFLADYDIFVNKIEIDTELGKKLKNSQNPNVILDRFIEQENAISIYTDGSKMSDAISVGTACISNSVNIVSQKSINNLASIYTAECIALNEACDIALQNTDKNVIILTDSLSALQKLKNLNFDIKSNSYIYEIKNKAIEFSKLSTNNSKIKLIWIPSHIGISGNEQADKIAKIATNNPSNPNTRIPFTDLRQKFKLDSKKETEKTIRELSVTKGTEYFTYYYKDNTKPWFDNCKLKRANIVMINRSRANHYNLAASLARVNFVNDAICQCNTGEQDLDHILWHCPIYTNQRITFVNEIKKLYRNPPHTIRTLLTDTNPPICKILYKFFANCKLDI